MPRADTKFLAQTAVREALFEQVVDHFLLVPVNPAGQGNDEKFPRLERFVVLIMKEDAPLFQWSVMQNVRITSTFKKGTYGS